MNIILAPHGDDEIIGCYSILDTIDKIIYFQDGDRMRSVVQNDKRYMIADGARLHSIKAEDTIFIPSKYDFHPLHKTVNRIGLSLPAAKQFYSIEMNVPWLEEEFDPHGKRALLKKLYPDQVETLAKNDKYFLFRSIKPFDDIIWASIKFEREGYHAWPQAPAEVAFLQNLHRHKFYFEVRVQQFGDDRDLEYFLLSRKVQAWFDAQSWEGRTSCEMFAISIKRYLEGEYVDRLVQVSVKEDDENGAIIQ
jgi:hypothetical protein